MDFLSCFLRNISAFIHCKLNVPEFTFPKKNAILLLFCFTSGEGGRFSVKRQQWKLFFIMCKCVLEVFPIIYINQILRQPVVL